MCNLYDLGRARRQTRDDWEAAVARALKESRLALLEESDPEAKRFGVRKTDPGLVLIAGDEGPLARTMRWGFHRPFNPAINNARSEKLDGPWSESWEERQRCLIPMSAFYEWQGAAGAKQTFAFVPAGEGREILWAAGIWEPSPPSLGEKSPRECYSMLTTRAEGEVAGIHDRQPVLLAPGDFEEFLHAPDPRSLLRAGRVSLEIFRCRNPLRHMAGHEGPERENFLPGFE